MAASASFPFSDERLELRPTTSAVAQINVVATMNFLFAFMASLVGAIRSGRLDRKRAATCRLVVSEVVFFPIPITPQRCELRLRNDRCCFRQHALPIRANSPRGVFLPAFREDAGHLPA